MSLYRAGTQQVKLAREYLLAWSDAAGARAQRALKQRIVEDAVAFRATDNAFHTWLWLYRARMMYGRCAYRVLVLTLHEQLWFLDQDL